MSRDQPLRIGLTGGIGSGKSTVASPVRRTGSVHRLTPTPFHVASRSPAAAHSRRLPISSGPISSTPSGALDRARMRDLAFADPAARQRLEAILHPLIRTETALQAGATASAVVVFDVPLLVESGRWREQVDKVLVIDCSEATQVCARHGALGLDLAGRAVRDGAAGTSRRPPAVRRCRDLQRWHRPFGTCTAPRVLCGISWCEACETMTRRGIAAAAAWDHRP